MSQTRSVNIKTFLNVGLAVVLSALMASSALAENAKRFASRPEALDSTTIHTIQVLPPEVSRSLELTPVPTSRPIPLKFGSYWDCKTTTQGLETCRFKLVVCTDDGEVCVET